MDSNEALEKKLSQLRREYRGVRSMLEMMQKGTEVAILRKMREEKLAPIEREIQTLEEQLKRKTA